MKRTILKSVVTVFAVWCSLTAYAYDVCVDGIFYNLDINNKTAEVTYEAADGVSCYKGDIVIPESFLFGGVTFSVTSIGKNAFSKSKDYGDGSYAYFYNTDLTSVSIPNSVTSICDWAFSFCGSLTSVVIPNSVTSIGGAAFRNCSGLTSLIIPNSVTSISSGAFYSCSGLTTVSIPKSVTSIGDQAFSYCRSLTSVIIPNSVTSIDYLVFSCCSSLTSIIVENGNIVYDSRENCNAIIETASNTLIAGCRNTSIPNSVTSIGNCAFQDCLGLTSVSIPNSVTSIGFNAFLGCSNLTSVSIPSSITFIDEHAFSDCSLTNVYSYAKYVPETKSEAFSHVFSSSNTEYATLHVPAASLESYQTTSPWSDFGTIVSLPTYRLTYMIDGVVYQSYEIEEGADIVPEENPTKEHYTFSGWSEIPATMPNHDVTITGSFTYSPPPKCATPTITLGGNGQIEVECATEGAKCVTTIMTTTTTEDSKIDLNESSATYHISAYATAEGYLDSDVVTTSFKWSKKNGDLNGDNLVNISDVTTLVNMILGR